MAARRGTGIVRVDIAGLKGLAKALDATHLYEEVLQGVLDGVRASGVKRLLARVPYDADPGRRTVGPHLRDVVRSRLFTPKAGKAQTSSVSVSGDYGALTRGSVLDRTKARKRVAPGAPGAGGPYYYVHGPHEGEPVGGWFTSALRTMRSAARREMRKAPAKIEAVFLRTAGSVA